MHSQMRQFAIGRDKRLIGPKLRARSFTGQQGDVARSTPVLNRMIREGEPVTIRLTDRQRTGSNPITLWSVHQRRPSRNTPVSDMENHVVISVLQLRITCI